MAIQELRAHLTILLVLALFFIFGILYGITTPLFEKPDEHWHFAFVQHVATGRGLPVQTEPLTHLARQEGSQPPLYYLLAAGLTFWIDTSDFPDIVWENPHYGYDVPGIINDNKNLFIHTSLESFPYRGAVLAIHLARLLSVLMGTLAVLFTYLLALEVFSTQRFVAASAAGIVAFTPQFLFVSSAVSNDSTIVAMSALVLWLVAVISQRSAISNRAAFALGVACGFAALAKVSGLGLVALAVVVLAWSEIRGQRSEVSGQRSAVGGWQSEIRNLKSKIVLFAFAFLLVAGWWYARNLVLYGELTGTARMAEIFHLRTEPMSFDQLLLQLREVWETFWLGFGWGNVRAHPFVYTLIEIFVAFSLLGWILAIRNSQLSRNLQFAILFTWLALMFAALIYWMQTTQAPHGRLLFPALPAFAVLLVAGLEQLQRSKVSQLRLLLPLSFVFRLLSFVVRSSSFVIFLLVLAALAPFLILQPAYTYPPTLDANAILQVPNRVDISYDDKIMLLGYDVSARRVFPGDSIELTLYWQALKTMDEDYSIGISVVDERQRVIGMRNSYPGKGMLPTRLWYAGQAIRDTYWLPIEAGAPAGVAQIQVSVYERTRRRNLIALDPRGEIITPFIGQIEVVSK